MPQQYVDPICDRLDPKREMIAGRLYKVHTRYIDGKHARDLSVLERDQRRVLFVSSNPDSYYLQPENCIKVKPWKGP